MAVKQTKVEVTGDSSKYERAMLETERISRRVSQGIMKHFKGVVGMFTAGFGIGKVVSEMTEMVRMSEVQRKAVGGMETAMRSMGRYTPEMSGQLQDLATSLQKVSNYGDAATLEGTKFLITYRNITDDLLPRSQKAMLDLAALMGGDAVRAANMLGKASMGMTGELQRVGITVDSATYKTEGYLGVLKQIEEQVGGQAAAMADPWTQLSNVVGDAKESLGGFISLAFEDYAQDMISILPQLSKSWREVAKAIDETRRVEARYQLESLQRQLEGGGFITDLPGTMAPSFTIKGMTPEEETAIRAKIERMQAIIKEVSEKNAPKIGGTDGEGALEGNLADMIEKETMKFEAALAQRSQMEIFMESGKYKALQDMEQGHREWEMEQLTSSAEYKQTIMQAEHDQALTLLNIRMEEEVRIALEKERMLKNIEMQGASARLTIYKGLGTALLNIVGANNEAIFVATRGFDAAMAIISGYAAGARALAELGPIAGPPVMSKMITLGYLQAAAIMATAIGQLAASHNTGATGAGTYVSPVVTSSVNAPATIEEQAPVQKGNVYINIEGDSINDEEYLIKWAERISEMVEDYDVHLISSRSHKADGLI